MKTKMFHSRKRGFGPSGLNIEFCTIGLIILSLSQQIIKSRIQMININRSIDPEFNNSLDPLIFISNF